MQQYSARWPGVFALAGCLICAPATPFARESIGDDAERCAALVGQVWPGARVIQTDFMPPSAANTVRIHPRIPDTVPVALPARCRVEGVIDERTGLDGVSYGLRFLLALPQDWNGRFAYQGGGGFNGALSEPVGSHAGLEPALARGFAVISTDGGHQGGGVAFLADQQAALDFAFNAVPTVTRLGQHLTTRYYGVAPHHSYSIGCSTGGREGLLAAQTYPLLFDGVLAGAPAMNTWRSQIASWNVEVAFNRIAPLDPQTGAPLAREAFSADEQRLLYRAVANRCDLLDGLADGIIANPRACQFDPAQLQCRSGEQANCLSAGKVEALRTAFSPVRPNALVPVSHGFPWDLGLLGEHVGNAASLLPSGVPTQFGPPPDRFMIDFDVQAERIAANPAATFGDASRWTNLGTFHHAGGKMILWHGAADAWFSMLETADYYERMRAANQGADFSRFYSVPGMGHCGNGGTDSFDMLTALVDWVEHDSAPEQIIATSSADPALARPLCPWPSYPHFAGGDPAMPSNFICRAE